MRMLSTHLQHRELYCILNLTWRQLRRGCDGSPPPNCPVKYRTTHLCIVDRCTPSLEATSSDLRAAQNRPNRVQTLLNHDKTTGANPGLPESRGRGDVE